MEQAGSDLWAIIAVGVAIVGLQWRMMSTTEKRIMENVSSMEKRITENADQAHEQISENINRLEKHLGERIDRVEDSLRADVKALTERFDRHLEHHQ